MTKAVLDSGFLGGMTSAWAGMAMGRGEETRVLELRHGGTALRARV